MKTLTVKEAQSRLGQLIARANRGEVIVLTDGRQNVTLHPGAALNLEEDTPELERELLKAIDGPYTPYSADEMRSVVERIIREEKAWMSLALQKADSFLEDFALQVLWSVREAGDDVARGFQMAVDSQLRLLCIQPALGRLRQFKHPRLQGLRSFSAEHPFRRILIFYREDGATLQAVRLMDAARDLPRRLAEPSA